MHRAGHSWHRGQAQAEGWPHPVKPGCGAQALPCDLELLPTEPREGLGLSLQQPSCHLTLAFKIPWKGLK